MKQLKDLLQAKQHLNAGIKPDEEPYILTPDEESVVIRNAIEAAKKHKAWKMAELGALPFEIDSNLAATKWEEVIPAKELLEKANSNKHYERWQQKQREKERDAEAAKEKELREAWTAGQMLKLMRWTSQQDFGRPLIENTNTMPLIKAICFFLSNDQRFETELGYTFKKGLLIRGTCGLGKTYTVRCVAANPLNPIHVHSMIEITDDVKANGEYELDFLTRGKFYLDDVGSEQTTVNHYGTKIHWFKDFLETFYLRSNQYNRLILSTNCGPKQLEDLYGFRVRSRIRDMFNLIEIEGEDLRGGM